MGQWAVYSTSPQSFIITFSYSLAWQLWGLLCILIGWFIKLSAQTIQPLILIYRTGNFVYHHWGAQLLYLCVCWYVVGCLAVVRALGQPFLYGFTVRRRVVRVPAFETKSRKKRDHGGRGHWVVNSTSPQSFILMFSYFLALKTLGT